MDSPGAGHAPHQVPKEWADKYKGVLDMGYEQYAAEALERMKKMGLMPENTDLVPMNSMADEVSAEGLPRPSWMSSGPGTRSATMKRGSSAAWPKCTPAS